MFDTSPWHMTPRPETPAWLANDLGLDPTMTIRERPSPRWAKLRQLLDTRRSAASLRTVGRPHLGTVPTGGDDSGPLVLPPRSDRERNAA